jgi:hypothetical protein
MMLLPWRCPPEAVVIHEDSTECYYVELTYSNQSMWKMIVDAMVISSSSCWTKKNPYYLFADQVCVLLLHHRRVDQMVVIKTAQLKMRH